MDRLAVCSLKRAPDLLVLVLSDPGIEAAGTVVAAPLMDAETFPVASVLNPVFELGGARFALATEQLAAVSLKELGPQVMTCIEHEYAIANAINRLFFGI
jgi:hypothetical protein